MLEAVIMIGVPYSGKSTLIAKAFPDYTRIDTDSYVMSMASSQNISYSQALKLFIKAAKNNMYETLENAIRAKQNIVWDQTNLLSKVRIARVTKLKNAGYTVKAVVFAIPSKQELITRRKLRVNQKVPEYILQSMIELMEQPSFSEGFAEITKIC